VDFVYFVVDIEQKDEGFRWILLGREILLQIGLEVVEFAAFPLDFGSDFLPDHGRVSIGFRYFL
jgi:hypothetical protein